MLRRLITCLALITGLAAAGAPLSAAMLDQADQPIASSECARGAKAAHCVCISQTSSEIGKGRRTVRCNPRKTIRVIVPTVQFGADRAYE